MAISKHVIAEDTLTRGGVGVGIDKSTDFGVVVAALEVVELSFSVIDIAVAAIDP